MNIYSNTQAPILNGNTEPNATQNSTAKQGANFSDLLSQSQSYIEKSTATKPSHTNTHEYFANSGNDKVNLDKRYSNDYVSNTQGRHINLGDVNIILPSAANVEALSAHASIKFKQMLSDYNIPVAPSKISYDGAGNMQLPSDYKYTEELKAALNKNPGLERELRDLNAITSHYVAIQDLQPFHEEMSKAITEAEIEKVIQKYSGLLSDNRSHKSTAISFSSDGNISMLAAGKTVTL